MNKKLLAITSTVIFIIILLLFVIIHSYIKQQELYNPDNYKKSAYVNLDVTSVSYEILTKNPSYRNNKLKYIASNNVNKELTVGKTENELDINLNGEWYVVPREVFEDEDAIAYILGVGETYKFTLYLGHYKLPGKGYYRIVRMIDVDTYSAMEFYLK